MSPDDANDPLAPEWDALLEDGLLEPPADFRASVMHRVHREADAPHAATAAPSSSGSLAALLEATAVLIGAIAAGWQTLAFVFGLWATTIAV